MDSDPGASFLLIALILFFLISAFFSTVKVVFLSIDKNSLPADEERLRFYASKIEDILEHRSLLNSTVSFGKTISNVAFSIIFFAYMQAVLPSHSWGSVFSISVIASILILSIFAYVLPRTIALRWHLGMTATTFSIYNFLRALLYFFSTGILVIHRLLLRLFRYDEKFAFLSAEERARMEDFSDSDQGLDKEEREMIHSIFELGETTVKEIMIPRVDIKALEINSNLDTVLKTIKEVGHSRIPVYRENIDSIEGLLYARDLLSWMADHSSEEWNLASLLKRPHFVPSGKMIDDLMGELKKRQIHIAIVVDEYGGTAGIVTLEDILEEIVGEIQDEYDAEEEPVVEVGPNLYQIDPHMDLHDLCERINIDLELEDVEYNTLGGLIYHEYGDVPLVNTEFDHDGLHIKVLEMDNQRIEKVQVEVNREPK
ncbi:MAG: hemolysin family protein [Fibrobacterota bacterium]